MLCGELLHTLLLHTHQTAGEASDESDELEQQESYQLFNQSGHFKLQAKIGTDRYCFSKSTEFGTKYR